MRAAQLVVSVSRSIHQKTELSTSTAGLAKNFHARVRKLEHSKTSLEKRKKTWQQEQQQAEKKWNQCNATVSAIEKKVQTRDILLNRCEEAKADFHRAEKEWKELGEDAPPNPQEQEVLLKKKSCHEQKSE